MADQDPQQDLSGVFVFRGSPVDIDEMTITIDDQGNVTHSGGGLRSGLEMWPLWIRVAIEHEANAMGARRVIQSRWQAATGEEQGELLQTETRAGLVAMSACAFALESMAVSAARRAKLPAGIGRNVSSAKRVAEVLKQCFEMTHEQFVSLRQSAIEIFGARNEAVHPPAGATSPFSHPAIPSLVPRPVHVFRCENANASVTTALSMALIASSAPKPRLGRKFRESVAPWSEFAQELVDRRDALSSAAQ